MKKTLRLAFFVSLLAVAGCDSGSPEAGDAAPQDSAGPTQGFDRSRAGTPLPDAELTDGQGQASSLAAEAGEPILVNLWATWCAPCVKELPTLEALGGRPGSPRVIAVSQDMAPRSSVDAFVAKNDLQDLEVWHDPEMSLSNAMNVEVLPTTILYDSSGREVWRYVGDLDWTGDQAAKLLAEGGAAAR